MGIGRLSRYWRICGKFWLRLYPSILVDGFGVAEFGLVDAKKGVPRVLICLRDERFVCCVQKIMRWEAMLKETVVTKLIQSYFDIVDRRDFDKLDTIFHSDVVYERPGFKTITGIDALLYFYNAIRSQTIARGTHEIESILVRDDQAACWGRFVGEDTEGKDIDERFADVYYLQDGLIIRRVTYFYREAI